MATKQQGNRKQRRDQRRSIRLRGDGSARSTKREPVSTRRSKRMLVPGVASAMVRHAEEMQKPQGLLADMGKRIEQPAPPIVPRREAAPCANLYGGCAPECGAGNRCRAEPAVYEEDRSKYDEQVSYSPKDAMHEEAAASAGGG